LTSPRYLRTVSVGCIVRHDMHHRLPVAAASASDFARFHLPAGVILAESPALLTRVVLIEPAQADLCTAGMLLYSRHATSPDD